MDDKKLKDHVNSSGFPLQIGLEHYIDATKDSHGWRVLSSEHPWRSEESGNSGFIDIILEKKTATVITIECKRVQNTAWIFLVPSKDPPKKETLTICWITRNFPNAGFNRFGWNSLQHFPESPEAKFCVIPGQDERGKPMLERIAADIIEATEALANQEMVLMSKGSTYSRIYFPTIVTTAEIKVCYFDPADINVSLGKIDNDKARFETVPCVRFRKSLTADSRHIPDVQNIRDLNRAKERTVIVINSNELTGILSKWKIDA